MHVFVLLTLLFTSAHVHAKREDKNKGGEKENRREREKPALICVTYSVIALAGGVTLSVC